MKKIVLIIILLIIISGAGVFYLSSNNLSLNSFGESKETGGELAKQGKLSYQEVRDIALKSSCIETGNLTENYQYNDFTRTWWIDLDAGKAGCSPACVIKEDDRSAEVNWRCTGAIAEEGEKKEATASAPLLGILDGLKIKSGIAFSDVQKVSFKWMIEGTKTDKEINTNDLEVVGQGYTASEVSGDKKKLIGSYFEENGFKIDVYNIGAGTIGSSTGYQKGPLVCLETAVLSGIGKEGSRAIPTITDKNDIEIKCGILEVNT